MAHRRRRNRQGLGRFRRRTLPGAPPGMLVPEPGTARPVLQVFAYGPDGIEERTLRTVSEIEPLLKRWPVTWVNVDGLGDTSVIHELGALFNLHNLALEDVVHTHQRAKVEPYDHYHFIVARMPLQATQIGSEQASIFLGERYVLTFQEAPGGDCWEPVRVRLRTGVSRLRSAGPDLLVYSLLDAIIDFYFPLLESTGERLDRLEDEVEACNDPTLMSQLHDIKRELILIRRAVWPLRDAINTLLRDASPRITDETRIYFRDCHDHTIQIIDLVETYRDIASGMTDVYLSTVGNRTNETMRLLTVISTIFIPLTFIAGVYGMNFDPDASPLNMPELRAFWGYPAAMTFMGALGLGMLAWFWRRGWLKPIRPTTTKDE